MEKVLDRIGMEFGGMDVKDRGRCKTFLRVLYEFKDMTGIKADSGHASLKSALGDIDSVVVECVKSN